MDTKRVRGDARRNSDARRNGSERGRLQGRKRTVAGLRWYCTKCSVSPLSQCGVATSAELPSARATNRRSARVSAQGMSPGTNSTGPRPNSSRADAIAPAGPAPQRSGRSKRNRTEVGRWRASSFRRGPEEVATTTSEASGVTLATTWARTGRSSTSARSLSPSNRRETPPARTMTGSGSAHRSDPGSLVKAFRETPLQDASSGPLVQ